MSDRTHKKQLERARAKRRSDRFETRRRRSRVLVLLMVALLVLALVGTALLAGGETEPTVDDPTDEQALDEVPEGPCPDPGPEVPQATNAPFDEPPRYELDPDATYLATLDTTCGEIVIEFDDEGAPRTVENFLALSEDGYYAGTPFHRVIDGFMIQGGDPTGTGTGCVDPECEIRLPGYAFDDELETAEGFEPSQEAVGLVVYPYGTVAMANAGPGTQGSQFFIVQNPEGAPLPPDYTAFGRVVDGLDVVDDIAQGPVEGDRALRPTVIRGVRVEQR